MTHRGRVLQQYTTIELRTVFIEMVCATKTSVDNPLMQPTGAGGRRSFLVLDEGELDGTYGYWAEDEEDGTEGFLDALDDVFWVYDEQNFSWFQRRFQGRRARKGKGKGRRKGKGKGRSGRRFFRPRGKGKGKRRGKGNYADEQSTTYPDEYFEELKVEDGKWTPVIDQELQNFLDSVERKPGWHQYANGHAQVAYRAKALRTPEPTYSRSRFCFRTSIVKRKGVWWLLETNNDIRNEKNTVTLEEEAETLVSIFLPAEHTYTVTQTPQLTPEVVEELLEHFMDPVRGSNSKNRSPIGMCCLHVDDLFVTGNDIFLKQFKDIVKSQFKIGHEDTNDLLFTGQRVAWKMQEKTKKKEYISVEQSLCVQELTEIIIPKGLKDEDKCDKDMHTAFRSLLGSINWLQSRTQFQARYQFSRSASASAGPTIGDCKALNKLCKQIVTDPMELRFWPLEGSPRLIAMPDAAFRNNSDKSSQRAMVVFMGEQRKAKQKNTKGSLIFFESSKIKRTTLSTTVAELYAFMKCYGTCQMLRGLIKDITGDSTDIHTRTDANNLVTTASTTHVPEQQETIHMIQMLRKEACSGAIADLSHIRAQWCLADCLTKKSASPQALIDAVRSGCLKEVDAHPPFRSLIEHKAYMRGWLPTVCTHVDFSRDVFYLGDSLH